MRGVFLHLMADALGSVIVIVSALIIWQTNWEYRMYVDPLLSVVMVFIILYSVWPLRKYINYDLPPFSFNGIKNCFTNRQLVNLFRI